MPNFASKQSATCEKSSHVQPMDKWAYPLTNVCKCGNGQEPRPCATVKDANGVVLLHFNSNPWRSPKDATAMATEFCERMNAQGNKIGNAAKCKEELGEVYNLLDKAKSYINDIEPIDRKRQFSHYLTRAKNLVDNIINQELSSNVSVGNAAQMPYEEV